MSRSTSSHESSFISALPVVRFVRRFLHHRGVSREVFEGFLHRLDSPVGSSAIAFTMLTYETGAAAPFIVRSESRFGSSEISSTSLGSLATRLVYGGWGRISHHGIQSVLLISKPGLNAVILFLGEAYFLAR